MANQYITFKNTHQDKVNAFPMMFAFSEDQFKEGMKKLGLEYGKDECKLLSISAGGFIRKSDAQAFKELFTSYGKRLSEKMRDHDFAVEAFYYELANHEYCITCDPTDALEALGLTVSDVEADQNLLKAFKEAREKYLKSCDGCLGVASTIRRLRRR